MTFHRITLSSLVAGLLAGCALAFSVSASAQYMWLDASGRKVFSDQPPPPNIPKKSILQQPGAAAATAAKPAATEATAEGDKPADAAAGDKAVKTAKPEAAAAKPVVAKDKDLEAAKKKIDDEAAAKKKAEQEARDVARADNCERAKGAKLSLASGDRIASINSKGERVIMDDAARQVETKRIEGIIASDCK
jgi:Domain of unknown function (DUF4124)